MYVNRVSKRNECSMILHYEGNYYNCVIYNEKCMKTPRNCSIYVCRVKPNV